MRLTRIQHLKYWLLAPLLALIVVAWVFAAGIEQGYYYLKGYSWDPISGGYWHRKTGEHA